MLSGKKVYKVVVLTSLLVLGTNLYARGEDYKYVVNISSSLIKQQLKSAVSSRLIKYDVIHNIKGKLWYKHRVGFFKNKSSALIYKNKIRKRYAAAYVDNIRVFDKRILKRWVKNNKRKLKVTFRKKFKPLSIKKQVSLLKKGKDFFIAKKYKSAIPIFRKLYESGSGAQKQKALELLGLARERNHQLSHAVTQYRKYLKQYSLYIKSSSRVKQRLDALLTASKSPKRSLSKKGKRRKLKPSWRNYGVLFQFYDKDEINISTSNSTIVSAEQLTTNISLSGRLVNSDYKIKSQFNAIQGYDLIDNETIDNRITSLYIDSLSPSKTYSTRTGRQRGSNGGVSGRYDGAKFGFRLNKTVKVNYVFGYPVEIRPTVTHKTGKRFNSLGMAFQSKNKAIDYNFYVFEQFSGSLLDRYEIGAEFRYITKKQSFITLYNYSLQFKKTNYFLSIMNWKFKNKNSLNIYFNHRRSPFLSTTNALQGQFGVSSLSDLLETLKEDEIEQLSSDRSAISKSSTIKYTMVHTPKIKYQIDYSISSLTGTVSSGGVAATSDTGNEYSYSASLLGKNWLKKYDNYLMRARISQLATSDANILDFSARYRFGKKWRVGPSLRFDNRDYDDGREVKRDRTLFRFDYRHNKSVRFQFNVSRVNKITTSPTATTQDISDNIIHLGCIYIF